MQKMRLPALGLVLFLVAAVSARYSPWAPGKDYIYRMHTISLNDIADLGSQSAGIKLDSQLIVQSRDANSIYVKLVEVAASTFNTDTGESWNVIEQSVGTPASINTSFLERPFIIRHKDGLFESLSVSRDEPLWSVNMKKAVASKLQLHVSGSRSIESAARNFASDSDPDDVNAVFKVSEDGVTGECETLYEISPLTDALVRSDGKLNPVPGLCTRGTYFQVVKTKDYDNCRIKPILNVVSPAGWKCLPGGSSCDTASSRSSVSRYIACGSPESFTLLAYNHQAEFRINPYGYDTQQLRAFSTAKMVLLVVRPLSVASRDMDVSVTLDSLIYSFAERNDEGGRLDGGRMSMPDLTSADKNQRRLTFEQLRNSLVHILDQAATQETNGGEDAGDDGTNGQVVNLMMVMTRVVRQFDHKEIVAVYDGLVAGVSDGPTMPEQVHGKRKRSIFLDTVMAAGSNPAVIFLKDAISNRLLTTAESIQALSGLPMYVRTPTLDLLNELYALVNSTSVATERTIFHTGLLSISKLVHMACVNKSEAAARFPVALYGDFCSPYDPLIVNRLVPLLATEISREGSIVDKMVALTALAEIGHESIINVVLPVIEGKIRHSPLVRTKAVISLHKLAHNSNDRVKLILAAIYQNPSENSEVRMAAFTLLILANPPAHQWQKIAVSTWFEPSAQVASFVYSTMYSLANNVMPLSNLKQVRDKAHAVLRLVKPVPVGLKYSHNWKWSHVNAERNAGIEFHSGMFNSEESLMLKGFYSRLSWALGPYHLDLFELEAYGENLREVWKRAIGRLFSQAGSEATGPGRGHNPRFSEYPLHHDLHRMNKQLNAKNPHLNQASGMPRAFLHLNLLKAIHRYSAFDETSIIEAIQGLTKTGNIFRAGSPGIDFDWRKWAPLIHSEIVMPNTLGLPITVQFDSHMLSSFRGNLKSKRGDFFDSGFASRADASKSRTVLGKEWKFTTSSFNNQAVDFVIKPKVVVQMIATMKVDVGLIDQSTVCGVDTLLAVALPGQFSAAFDMSIWKLLLSWKPASNEQVSLYHFHVRPFTSLRAVNDLSPVTFDLNTKNITAYGATLKKVQYPLFDWGVMLQVTGQSELPFEEPSGFRNPSASNILTAANFALLPASLHRRSYTLNLNPADSEMNQILFYINLDTVDKMDIGTKVYSSGSKTPTGMKDSSDRLQISKTVELQILRKLTKVLNPVKRGSAVHVDAKLIIDGTKLKVLGFSFAGAYGTEGTKVVANAQFDFPSSQQGTEPFTLCIEGDGTYPSLPSFDRLALISTHLEAAWNAKIGYGNTCAQHEVSINADLERSDEFARHVNASSDNRDCESYESLGQISHDKCLAVRDRAAVLDKYDITVKYSEMSAAALNVSLGVERFLKAWLYSHLFDNEVGVDNTRNQVRILARMHRSLDTMDVTVMKPHSNSSFHNIPLSDAINVFFPLSARTSLPDRVRDYTIGDGYAPICRLEKDSITTFDKVQYNARLNDCEHVALSAPGMETIGVLVRQSLHIGSAGQDSKIATLLIGRDKIEMAAASKRIRYNDMDVTINLEQHLEIQDEQSSHVAGIYQMGPDTFKVVAPVYGLEIITDGKSVIIKAARSLQGRLIGLCGNMDGETVSELRDPSHCILTSGQIMAASYLLSNSPSKCSGMPDEIRNQLRREQADCVVDERHPSRLSEGPTNSGFRPPSSCRIQRTLVVLRGEEKKLEKCFSTQIVTECKLPCQLSDSVARNIGFHCVPEGKLADEMEQEAKLRPLYSVFGKKEDFRATFIVPNGCRPPT